MAIGLEASVDYETLVNFSGSTFVRNNLRWA